MPLTWERLKALEQKCSVKFESFLAPDGGIFWRVTMSPHGRTDATPITAEAADISDAAREGIRLAVQAGWVAI